MGCKCDEISRCSRDIGRIEHILSLFHSADQKNGTVSGELNGLAFNCFSTFFCTDISSLNKEERELNKTLVELMPSMINVCKDKIYYLNEELSELEAEDEEYHDDDDDDDDD